LVSPGGTEIRAASRFRFTCRGGVEYLVRDGESGIDNKRMGDGSIGVWSKGSLSGMD